MSLTESFRRINQNTPLSEEQELAESLSTPKPLADSTDEVRELLNFRVAQASQRAVDNSNTLVSKLGLQPEGVVGSAINMAASIGDATSRTIGWGIQGARSTRTPDWKLKNQEEIDLHNRVVSGQATEEDIQRYEAIPNQKVRDIYSIDSGAARYDQSGYSIKERTELHKEYLEAQKATKEFFDTKWSDSDKKTALAEHFKRTWNRETERLGKAVDDIGDPQTRISGLWEFTKGVGESLVDVGAGVLQNPAAVVEMLLENAPQVVASAVTRGRAIPMIVSSYAVEEFNEGMNEYLKNNNGQLPSRETQNELAAYAASLALVEGLSIAVESAPILKGQFQGLIGRATSVNRAATRDLKRKGIIKSGLVAGAVEIPINSWQTYGEAKIRGKEASADEIFASGMMGALAGGGMTSTTTAIYNMALGNETRGQNIPSTVISKDFKAEIKNNNFQKYSENPLSKDYSPLRAVSVLFGNAKENPNNLETNYKRAEGVIKEASEVVEGYRSVYESLTPEGIAANEKKLAAVKDKIANTSDTEILGQLREIETALVETISDAKRSSGDINTAKKRYEDAKKELTEAEKVFEVLENYTSPLNIPSAESLANAITSATSTPTQQNVDNVINLSMASMGDVSISQLNKIVRAAENEPTVQQDSVEQLRRLIKSKEAIQTLESMGDVSKEILYGTKDNIGLEQYRHRIVSGIQRGNIDYVTRMKGYLERFNAMHKSKAEAASNALKKASTTGKSVTISRDPTGVWKEQQGRPTKQQIKDRTALQIHPQSTVLVRSINRESDAISQVNNEMGGLVNRMDSNIQTEQVRQTQPEQQTNTDTNKQVQSEQQQLVLDLEPTEQSDTQGQAAPVQEVVETAQPEQLVLPFQDEVSTEPVNTVTEEQSPPVTSEETVTTTNQPVADQTTERTVREDTPVQQAPVTQNQLDGVTETTYPVEALSDKAKEQNKDLPYNQANLVSKFGDLSSPDTSGANSKPLAVVSNFMTKIINDTVSFRDFIPEKLWNTEGNDRKRQESLQTFVSAFAAWRDTINSIPVKGKNPNFKYRNPIEYFIKEDGNLDENVIAAITYGSFNWYVNNSTVLREMTDADINSILGRPEHSIVTPEEKILLENTLSRNLTINEIGNTVIGVLGLRFNSDAPIDVRSKVASALGTVAVVNLERQGLIELSNSSFKTGEGKIQLASIKVVKDQTGNLPPVGQVIVKSQSGSNNILSHLFKSDGAKYEPSFEPQPFEQFKAKNTDTTITKRQKEVIQKDQNTPWKINRDMYAVFSGLNREPLETIAGLDNRSLDSVHIDRRLSFESKNRGIKNNLQRLADFIVDGLSTQPEGLNTPIYFDFEVWKNGREGMLTRSVNPNTSTIDRYMFGQESWITSVDPKNTEAVDDLFLRIGESFGIKTDTQTNTTSLEQVRDLMNNPEIINASDSVNKLVEGDSLTDNELDNLIKVTSDKNYAGYGGENFRTLQGLLALHRTRAGLETGNTIEVNLMTEVDGVNNGMVLASLLYGTDYSTEGLFNTLSRGGIYPVGSEYQSYNQWKDIEGHLDLYEVTMKSIYDHLNSLTKTNEEQAALDFIYNITGNLVTEGQVTKDGRDIVKTPLLAINFGSSTRSAVEGMSRDFIDSLYSSIERLNNNGDVNGLETLRKNLNRFIGAGQKYGKNAEFIVSLDLNTPINPRILGMIGNSFYKFFGKHAETSLNNTFGVFSQRRETLTNISNVSSMVYRSVMDVETKNIINNDKGVQLSVRGTPIHDITGKQQRQLDNTIGFLKPYMNSVFSKPVNRPNEGILAGDDAFVEVNESQYTTENRVSGRKGSIHVQGEKRVMTPPGVRMTSASVHSFDAGIISDVRNTNDMLNLFDAGGIGVNGTNKMAVDFNKSLVQNALEYSPLMEARDMFTRTLRGLEIYQKRTDKTSFSNVIRELKKHLESYQERMDEGTDTSFVGMVRSAYEQAYDAALVQYLTISEMGYVNQYALEKGVYEVTQDDRARASEKAVSITKEVPEDVIKIAESLDRFLNMGGKYLPRNFEVTDAQTAVMVLNDVYYRDSTPENVKEILHIVLDEIATDGKPLEAIQNSRHFDTLVQIVNDNKDSVVAKSWHEIGESIHRSDPNLVEALSGKDEYTLSEVVDILNKNLGRSSNPVLASFHKQMLGLLSKINSDVKIRMIRPENFADTFIDGTIPSMNSRGWFYSSEANGRTINLMDSRFVNSGLTSELILHELVHNALVEKVNNYDPKNPDKNVEGLYNLFEKTKEYVENNQLGDTFGESISSIHEFIAYGLTNPSFQKNVLANVQVPSTSSGFTDGLRNFISSAIKALFGGLGIRPKTEQNLVSGLASLVAHTTALLQETPTNKSPQENINLSMASSPMDNISRMTSEQLFNTLDNGNLTPKFTDRLTTLLTQTVGDVYGTFQVYKSDAQNSAPMTPFDTFIKSVETREKPFVSDLMAAPFTISGKEMFVGEQVEAIVSASLEGKAASTTMAYRELRSLYEKASKDIKPEDMYRGDWNTATDQEKSLAKAKYDFLFGLDSKGINNNFLSRFASMVLTNEEVSNLIGDRTYGIHDNKAPASNAYEKIKRVVASMVRALVDRVTGTKDGDTLSNNLHKVVDRLVSIESRRRQALAKEPSIALNSIVGALDRTSKSTRETLNKTLTQPFFKSNRSPYIKAISSISSVVANERVGLLLDNISRIRDTHFEGVHGTLLKTLNYMKGARHNLEVLLQAARHNDRVKIDIQTQVAKAVREAFVDKGAYITPEMNKAITNVYLRNDLSSLLGNYSIDQINQLVTDRNYLKGEIDASERNLRAVPNSGMLEAQAKALGFYLATGEVKLGNLFLNVGALAEHFRDRTGTVLDQSFKDSLNSMISLYALQYTNSFDKNIVSEVINRESNRLDGGNGLESAIRLHKSLLEESKERLFDNSEMLATKGYLPDIVNMDTKIEVVPMDDRQMMEDMGYKFVGSLANDKTDHSNVEQGLFILRDAGDSKYASGIMAMDRKERMGSSVKSSVDTFNSKNQEDNKIYKNPEKFNPETSKGVNTLPVLNSKGEIVDYRYVMNSNSKDTLLQRKNEADLLLGSLASNSFIKESGLENNKKAVTALKEIYDTEYANSPESFIELGAKVSDPEARSIWNHMNKDTQQAFREAFKGNKILVRKDVLDYTFGYKKYSLKEEFAKTKEERNLISNGFVYVAEGILKNYALHRLGYDETRANNYAKRAGTIIARGGNVMTELVRELKDTVVVKTLAVVFNNEFSNNTVLAMNGVPIKDIVRNKMVGVKATLQYQEESSMVNKLMAVRAMESDPTRIREIDREINKLEISLSRNPVKELFDRGLMPTIVDDISMIDDPYSYKSRIQDKVSKHVNRIPKPVRKVGNFIYMGKDTTAYKVLYQSTQLSDFVARYTLYEHLTNRKRNPLSKEEASKRITDAFVNYDVPLPKGVQYLDDLYLLPFSKYFLSIQRVLFNMVRENPARVLSTVLASNYLDVAGTVMDSSILPRLGNNPLYPSVAKLPDAMSNTLMIKPALGLFR